MKPKTKLIYIAQPYGGNPENYMLASHYLETLVAVYPEYCFVSPVICYGTMYDDMTYEQGMELCLTLLLKCDELWLLTDGKGNIDSRGTIIERDYAAKHNIKVVVRTDI